MNGAQCEAVGRRMRFTNGKDTIGYVQEYEYYYFLETPDEDFCFTTFQEAEEKADELYEETGKTF